MITKKKILEIGLKMEESARDFYLTLKDRVVNPATRQMLAQLAEEEARHVELFAAALQGKDVQFGVDGAGVCTRLAPGLTGAWACAYNRRRMGGGRRWRRFVCFR